MRWRGSKVQVFFQNVCSYDSSSVSIMSIQGTAARVSNSIQIGDTGNIVDKLEAQGNETLCHQRTWGPRHRQLTFANQELPFGAFGIRQRVIGLDHGNGMNTTPVSSHRGIPRWWRKDAVNFAQCQLDRVAHATGGSRHESPAGGGCVRTT